MPPSESLPDPSSAPSLSVAETSSPNNASHPSANGDEETALARLADDGGPSPPPESETPNEAPSIPRPSLEERVHRLEELVALLQERHAAAPRMASVPAAAPTLERPPEARPVAAAAVAAPPATTAMMLDLGKRLLGASSPIAPVASAPVANIASRAYRGSLLWFLSDTWAEARAIVRMFLDPRYQLPWSARVLPLLILAAILTSGLWVPGSSIYILGSCLTKAVDLLLAYLLFKWLGHEARRYRQTSPDLPANLRL